jgi:poly(hydroxyalkanoate) depolymerase family esterase
MSSRALRRGGSIVRQLVLGRWPVLVLGVLAVVGVVALTFVPRLASGPAAAAAVPVEGFGTNPGNLAMYVYLPDDRPAAPALVVALHGCTQSADDYLAHSGWRELADRDGFVLVLPEQKIVNNLNRCFNWFEESDVRRGSGEALSVIQMIDAARSAYGVDPKRVFVTGLSAGGAMTAALLATYPDVFAAGAVVAALTEALTCMSHGSDRTPLQWAQQVRAASPGYAGPYPRVAIWHGTADRTVSPVNAEESRDQWVGVHNLSPLPTSTKTLPGSDPRGTVQEVYADASGRPLVEVYWVQGMGHGAPVDPGGAVNECGAPGPDFLDTICSSYYTARFWGLEG